MTRTERQLEVIDNWKKAGCIGSFVGSTGFGKTRTAILAMQRVLHIRGDTKIVIVVPTEILKSQWQDELERYQIDAEILIINTASRKPFDCNFLVIDEIHRAAADSLRKVFENTNPKLILGLTATYERLDGKEKEVLDKYAPKFDEVTVAESKLNGWIAPYKEYKVMIDVDLTEYTKANQEFMNHFAFFNYSFDDAMKAVTDFWYQQVLAKKMNCDVKEVKAHAFAWNRALRFRKNFIANHPKKLEIAKKILEHRSNIKAITFNSSIKQCEAYKMGYVLHSGNTKKKNSLTLEEFSKCSDGVLHTSKMADEGLDIRGLQLAIICGFTSSQTSARQRLGRVCRFEPGKEAELFVLVLKGTQDEKWFQKANEGIDYIEISENELDDILNNKDLINKNEITQEKVTNLFRF